MQKNRRSRIIETNYGRDCGWYVEVEGRKLAVLTDPQWDDMFWVSYRMEPLTEDAEERALLYTAEFWYCGKVVYRNREFDDVVSAFVGGPGYGPVAETGRLSMRGLYLMVPDHPWGWVFSWWKRFWYC